jgi:hypothetical protein
VFSSLRFRLTAVFLGGLVLAGLVAAVLAARLFQDYTRDQTFAELGREAAGLAQLYGTHAGDVPLNARILEKSTGDVLFFAPLDANFDLEILEPERSPWQAKRQVAARHRRLRDPARGEDGE